VLLALAAALGFAFLVPRRSANDMAAEGMLVRAWRRGEPERSAA